MVNGLERIRELVGAALAALERNRGRIDDLNVYPVPDGDTGTNLTLTARRVVQALESSRAADRVALAEEIARAALMGARGNSGVILSQIVRGAAEVLGRVELERLDPPALAAALRGASDAAYRAVRRPVEGTMLTMIRELAEEAERRAVGDVSLADFLRGLVRHGERALARTTSQLATLREAGVVDAGAAGVVEIVRGITASITGDPVVESPASQALPLEAAHQEESRYRYCTGFLVEGEGLDADALERVLEPLGDSLLVVGDARALRVHVHTDDPGAALTAGGALGVLESIEIANMRRQAAEREERLAEREERLAERGVAVTQKACEVVAVVAGAGNARIFGSLGAGCVLDGGRTMNPSTQELVQAIDGVMAPEAIVLPNNPNVIMSAEQAATLAARPARVLHTRSIQAGLAAMVLYDGTRSAEENALEMQDALDRLGSGAVTVASRDVSANGIAVTAGAFLGLVEGEAVAAGDSFDEVSRAVVDRLLAEPRDVLTLLRGEGEPELEPLAAYLREHHPTLQVDVQDGGQPHYPLLLAAE